jgi:mutator protein MutT
MSIEFPNITVTFVIEYKNRFLLTHRSSNVTNYSGKWAFPGGKCEIGETAIDTLKREVLEETSLELTDEACFLDTYFFKKTVGIAFLVRATSSNVVLTEDNQDFKWISSVEELKEYDCTEGIYNHLVRALELLAENNFDSLERMNLTPNKYLNK